MPVPRTLREEQWAACSEHRGRGALHFSAASLKGHQTTPYVHVCACTCVHQSLLFPPSPCVALKSVWKSQPNLTSGLRTQIHQAPTSSIDIGKGERSKSETPQRRKTTVWARLLSAIRESTCATTPETLMLLDTKASTPERHRKPGFTSSTAPWATC